MPKGPIVLPMLMGILTHRYQTIEEIAERAGIERHKALHSLTSRVASAGDVERTGARYNARFRLAQSDTQKGNGEGKSEMPPGSAFSLAEELRCMSSLLDTLADRVEAEPPAIDPKIVAAAKLIMEAQK